MEIKIIPQTKKFKIEGTDELKEEIVNYNIGYIDKKGRLRWETQDKLEEQRDFLDEILLEVEESFTQE